MLPIEVMVPSLRFFKQNGLTPQEYSEAMMMELESTDDIRKQAFKINLKFTKLTNIGQKFKIVNCNSVFENTEPVRFQNYSRWVKEDDLLNPSSGLVWLHDVGWP